MQCRLCETTNPDDNMFCESCGTRMGGSVPAAACCTCGAPLSEMDSEGFCGGCGRRLKRPDSDHIEVELLSDFAGVSDRGLRHNRNEDRFAITQSSDAFAIVCDGVAMSPDADEAAQAAVQATVETLNEGLAKLEKSTTDLLRAAIRNGSQAVTELGKRKSESPSTTLVAAILRQNRVTVGWIGDSRAYWLNGSGAVQLTRDHSWENSAAAQQAGAEAQRAANSHALMRWVGADAPDFEPEILEKELRPGGLLLLCSDGLWNYAPNSEDMAALIASASKPGATAMAVSRELVEFARAKGGHDNITAVVLRHSASEGPANGG